MAVQDRTATLFPTFTRAAATVRADITGQLVSVWSVAVIAFALLHTAVTFGASYWRFQGDAAAHDGAVAAIDRFNAIAVTTGSDWSWQQIGAPALDLDPGAALGQVIAATTAFGLLLAVALLLLAHGRTIAAFLAALTTGLSVVSMSGLLAWTVPMIPSAGATDPAYLNLDQYPVALREARTAVAAASAAQDTATWWVYAVGAVVVLIAVGAVGVARRRHLTYAQAPVPPVLVDLLVVLLVTGATWALLGTWAGDETWRDGDTRLLAATLVVALLSARAATCSRIGTAVALSIGFGIVHLLLYASFDRDGGAPGGWGVGSGGPQVHASTASAAVLVVTPVVAWIAGAVWAHLAARRAESAAAEALPV